MRTIFSKKLTSWFSIHKRELPWRETKNPYFIWLSEIILQQTQIVQGLPYYLNFVEAYPTVNDLANASEDQVLKLWQGLGYYSRARNLHHSAKQVVDEFNGNFPENYEDLLKLKGVGDYTASAIASICFDAPTAVVDGNVYRVLSRFFGISTPINSSAGQKEFKSLAQDLLPSTGTGDHNQALMEFGARQCRPKSPDCSSCIFNTECYAFNQNMVNSLPVKIKNKSTKVRYFNYLVIQSQDSRTILRKRDKRDIWQNLFEFPLIESSKPLSIEDLKAQETFIQTLAQLDFEILENNPDTVTHKLSHQTIHSRFWPISVFGTLSNSIPLEDIREYAVPILIANYIKETNFVDSYQVR